jgi:pimeloyl-ACP methyl ester carboxylesterase
VFHAWQDGLIFPGQLTQGTPEARVLPPPDARLVPLTTERGDSVTALLARATGPDHDPGHDRPRPTVLFFYGNGMCLAATLDLVAWFRSLGAHVMVPDYVGYGLSSGRPSEAGCHDTARACLRHLQSRSGDDIDPDRIIAAGWSLGGAVAIELASTERVAALAAFSTFTTLADAVTALMPWVPARSLLRHRFDSLSAIARVSRPILLGHGQRDALVPAAMMGQLAAAAVASERVRTLLIDDADHGDFFETGRDRLTAALSTLIDEVAARP